jgi:hypothetical protein
MKIIPLNGCIIAAYYDSELIFCMGEKWDAQSTIEQAICDNTSFERVQLCEPQDFKQGENHLFTFLASYDQTGELEEEGYIELYTMSLY